MRATLPCRGNEGFFLTLNQPQLTMTRVLILQFLGFLIFWRFVIRAFRLFTVFFLPVHYLLLLFWIS